MQSLRKTWTLLKPLLPVHFSCPWASFEVRPLYVQANVFAVLWFWFKMLRSDLNNAGVPGRFREVLSPDTCSCFHTLVITHNDITVYRRHRLSSIGTILEFQWCNVTFRRNCQQKHICWVSLTDQIFFWSYHSLPAFHNVIRFIMKTAFLYEVMNVYLKSV